MTSWLHFPVLCNIKPMGVSGFVGSFDSSKQRISLWPKALRLSERSRFCSDHRKNRGCANTNNSEKVRRCGDAALAMREGNTPKGRHIRDIGFDLKGPSQSLLLHEVDFGRFQGVGAGIAVQV